MTLWHAVLVASLVCFALKGVGYLVPASALAEPRRARTVDLLTVALLGALVAVQTFGLGETVAFDARIPAILVAGVLLLLRAPFLVVVISAAVVAALLRMWGLAA